MSKPIFVNRMLNLKKIKAIGLDMDHTLIRYQVDRFEALVFELAINRLIEARKYPEVVRALTFSMQDAIRGLVIDSEHGNILKLSRFGAIRESYHGTQRIDFKDQQVLYNSTYVDLNLPNYEVIDTSFSIGFCSLYSQLVDLKDTKQYDMPSYQEMVKDVLGVVDDVHRDGSLKQKISENLDKYVIKDKRLVEMMARFVRFGKEIIIITNSEYSYMKTLLEYAVNPFLPEGTDWSDFFQYVIASSRKPRFFYEDTPFYRIDIATGEAKTFTGDLVPGVYQGGNAKELTDALKLKGDEILYIGDHIYGDILKLKKICKWRTALIVEELGGEIEAQQKAYHITKAIRDAMDEKSILERKHVKLLTQYIDKSSPVEEEAIENLQNKIMLLDGKVAELLGEERGFYHSKWGQVFRAGAEESYFAYQVERYACVYMERLVDFFSCSPLTYFRADRRKLPHDVI